MILIIKKIANKYHTQKIFEIIEATLIYMYSNPNLDLRMKKSLT